MKEDQEKMDDAIDEAIRSIDLLIQQDLVAAQQRLHSFNANN